MQAIIFNENFLIIEIYRKTLLVSLRGAKRRSNLKKIASLRSQ